MHASSAFICEPDPENPGWHRWANRSKRRFPEILGPMLLRTEGKTTCRLRMMPATHHSNVNDVVHGGVTLSLIDVSLFAAAHALGAGDAAGSVTLGLECSFVDVGEIGKPLDAVTEILRETGRLIFLRGLVEQGETVVASFSGTIRKPPPRRA